MTLPLERWHNNPTGVSLIDAQHLLGLMPEWRPFKESRKYEWLFFQLPKAYEKFEYRESHPIIPKRVVEIAITFSNIECQACFSQRNAWCVRHTDKEYNYARPLRRFNSEIFDAIAGHTMLAVCMSCCRQFRDDADLFAVKTLERQIKRTRRMGRTK